MRRAEIRQHLTHLIRADIQRPRQRRQLAILKPAQIHRHHRLIGSQRLPVSPPIRSHFLFPFPLFLRRSDGPANPEQNTTYPNNQTGQQFHDKQSSQ